MRSRTPPCPLRGSIRESFPLTPCLQPKAAILRRNSKIRIIRPSAAFRRGPLDVLRRVLDVASFAMDAILRVDDEPRLLASRLVRIHHLVNASRAIEARRLSVARKIVAD